VNAQGKHETIFEIKNMTIWATNYQPHVRHINAMLLLRTFHCHCIRKKNDTISLFSTKLSPKKGSARTSSLSQVQNRYNFSIFLRHLQSVWKHILFFPWCIVAKTSNAHRISLFQLACFLPLEFSRKFAAIGVRLQYSHLLYGKKNWLLHRIIYINSSSSK
jgi:hypothetical protein